MIQKQLMSASGKQRRESEDINRMGEPLADRGMYYQKIGESLKKHSKGGSITSQKSVKSGTAKGSIKSAIVSISGQYSLGTESS